MGEAFKFLWETGSMFFTWELDFGDIKFTLWEFCLAAAVLSIIIVLVRGFFTRGDD